MRWCVGERVYVLLLTGFYGEVVEMGVWEKGYMSGQYGTYRVLQLSGCYGDNGCSGDEIAVWEIGYMSGQQCGNYGVLMLTGCYGENGCHEEGDGMGVWEKGYMNML